MTSSSSRLDECWTRTCWKFGLSPSKNLCVICLIESHLKMMKNVFFFSLKSFFCSQDINFFVTTFWLCRKNSLIRKIRLTSKFMMSQPGLKAIPIQILPNISQSKGSKTMKFGQLIEHSKRNIFLLKLRGKWESANSSRPLFIF